MMNSAKLNSIKLGIALPLTWTHVFADTCISLLMLDKPCETVFIHVTGDDIAEMRNRAVQIAQHNNCTHLLQLDADMIYPSDMIMNLLKHDKDIVGALTFKRYPPFDPLIRQGEPFKLLGIYPYPEKLLKVTATGTGCLMTKMSVYEKIKEPWFEFDKTVKGHPVGEDINFCYKAKKAGLNIYVDTTIKTAHLATMRINETFSELYRAVKTKEIKDAAQG